MYWSKIMNYLYFMLKYAAFMTQVKSHNKWEKNQFLHKFEYKEKTMNGIRKFSHGKKKLNENGIKIVENISENWRSPFERGLMKFNERCIVKYFF